MEARLEIVNLYRSIRIMTVNTEFTLHEFKVSYTMCVSDTLERSQQVNPQDSGFITWEGSTHTYKVSLVPAGK